MKVAAFLAIATLTGAALAADPETPSALVVLDHSASGALAMVGNSRVEIPARAVYVNSSSSTAVSTTGSAILDAPFLYVVGNARFNGQSQCTGTVVRSVAPYTDPCASTPFPSTSGMTNHGSKSISGGSHTLQPGYYSGGISMSGNPTVTFSPGVYVIGGSGLSINNGTITGEGVCLIIQAGALNLGGSSGITLTPMAAGPLAGVVIAQPPSNTTQMELRGGAEVNIAGTVYAPKATLRLVGNSTVTGAGPQMGDLVVANKLDMRGTGTIKIGRPGSPPLQLPVFAVYD